MRFALLFQTVYLEDQATMPIPVDEPPVGCQATSMAFRLLEVVGLHTLILAHRVTLLV